jgi:uncharacterized repeat protein (TIGR03803 family)
MIRNFGDSGFDPDAKARFRCGYSYRAQSVVNAVASRLCENSAQRLGVWAANVLFHPRALAMRQILPLSMGLGLAIATLAPGQSRAANLTTLYSFCAEAGCPDGSYPGAALIADANGNLFGTTADGGAYGYGTVFEIAKTAGGYAGTPTTLVSFNLIIGAFPYTALIADVSGDLFGTTLAGGPEGYGTVFEIAKTTGGFASTPTTLLSFNLTNGGSPFGGLIADANGNLFGTTEGTGPGVGTYRYGTIFEIAKTAGGYAGTATTLVSFNGTDGEYPFAGLIADANGNLFGTTAYGGAYGYGTVFEIGKTAGGYAGTPTTLVSFNGADGAYPFAGLIADANGNLFGTTEEGGAYGSGTVFEIAKTASGYADTPTTLVSFNGANGAYPAAGSLIADASGNLFGTTEAGGPNGYGTVFEIAKTARGYAGAPTTLVSFNGADGGSPVAGLIADANGNLFGTTLVGGAYGYGTVFEITGSGFVPAAVFSGTPGAANCDGNSVSALAPQYGGLAAAAAALGYSSVQALQNAIAAYCEG